VQPDLILVMTDQQRYDQIGYAAAGAGPSTPTLDRLAAAGVTFGTAYSASTNCVPARTTLMTGLLDHKADYAAPRALRPGTSTLPRMLAAAGYETALVGKMHFTPIRADHGFDHLRVCEHFTAYSSDAYATGPLDHYHDWLVEEGHSDWRFDDETATAARYPLPPRTHPTSWVRDEALALLAQRDRTRPLFLVVSFPHPHPPINPPEPYATLYDPDLVEIDPTEAEHNDGLPPQFRAALAQVAAPHRRIDPANLASHRASLARTWGLITQIDDAVAAVIDQLDLDRSLLWFTSDHGDYGGHRGLIRKIPWIPFDDLARVPCFATGWSVAGGRRDDAPMQSFDMVRTFLAAAGLEAQGASLDGLDLLAMLTDPVASLPTDRYVFSALSVGWPMVRRGSHKYIREAGWGEEVLFDLEGDPSERYNFRMLDPDRRYLDDFAAAVDAELRRAVRP
jgi:choline-sulfatase